MTVHDENEARSPDGGASGALERRASGEMASPRSSALATAGDEERSPAPREERTPDVAGPAGPGGGEAPAAVPDPRRRRRLRVSLIVAAAIAVAAAAGLAATGALGGDSEDSGGAAPTAPPATAKVQRTTLTDTQVVDGNLGYGSATSVQAPATSSGSGQPGTGTGTGSGSDSSQIITWLPDEGRVIERGDAVYRVDEQKIPLLYGSFPLYRTLEPGVDGADVKMLEKNLSELGYTGFTVDDEYTGDTADAVREWQDDLNQEETGTVSPADAVIAVGARRVATHETVPGAALSGAVLSWTDTERIVSVDLDVAYEDLVDEGVKATAELPDGSTVEAEVTDIGTPSSAGTGDSAGNSGDSGSAADQETTLPVELTVKDTKGLGRYQAAAVEVTFEAGSRENVLAVPVQALMARQGGGYAVEVVTGTGTELRPVTLGMFADGMVEVSGTGITEGTVVGVPE